MIEQNKQYEALFDELLRLRYPAIAIKLIENEAEVPTEAKHPYRDLGQKVALCQAYTMARRQGLCLYLTMEDHWCWTPPMLFGLQESGEGTVSFDTKVKMVGVKEEENAKKFVRSFPRLPVGKYPGMVIAPLDKADFLPDVLLLYCAPYQLRLLITAVNAVTGDTVKADMSPLESCGYSVIPPILSGDYAVTVPDPGECDRAAVGDDEMIFSVPRQRFEEFFSGMALLRSKGKTVNRNSPILQTDFKHPPFYDKVFESWGL